MLLNIVLSQISVHCMFLLSLEWDKNFVKYSNVRTRKFTFGKKNFEQMFYAVISNQQKDLKNGL